MRRLLQPDPDRAAEIASQREFLFRFNTTRMLATFVVALLMSLFLPLWLVLLFQGLDYLFEAAGFWLIDGLDPDLSPGRYRLTLITVFLMEAVFIIPAAMIWNQDDAYCKALAVGLVCMALFQLASVRAIHLPFGVAGMLGALATGVPGNTIYWLERGDWVGFSISSLAIAAVCYYALAAMQSNHLLHREIVLRGRKATIAEQAKGRFLAQISHELRTPLNAILGMGAAERVETTHPRTKERMETLVASARELAVILDDVLEMSALGENALPIRPVPTSPQAVIAGTAALFRPLFDSASLSLTLRSRGPIPDCVMLDPHRLRQCLSNLLSNALKFTESGGVSVSWVMATASILEIEVTNTGQTISAGDAEAIFSPFNNRDGKTSGSGLGLAISRGLARKMGGDLIVLPCNTGARFRLCVAVTACADSEPVESPDTSPAETEPTQALSGLRVLVVDDIATNRLVATTFLKHLGARPLEAKSGEAALAVIQTGGADVVLLDMNMPGLSGAQTLAAIRALPLPHRRVKVLAMTADASQSHRQTYLAIGMDGFVAKPLAAETLAAAILNARSG